MNEVTRRFIQWIDGHPYLSHGVARLLYACRNKSDTQKQLMMVDFIIYRGAIDSAEWMFASRNLYNLVEALRLCTKQDYFLKEKTTWELDLERYLKLGDEIEWKHVFELEYQKGSRKNGQ